MLQGWYWDYDKNGCNDYTGPNWTTRLNDRAAELEQAGFTYVWLPPASRASFGACSNGYDPKDLYDLGEYGLGRTGFGTRSEVDALISNLNRRGMEAVADVVYNHRDGGAAEDNPAAEAYIEDHFNGRGKQPFPSDRFRYRLPLGTAYGPGNYYIKIRSKTRGYGASTYKFYADVSSTNAPYAGSINESEPNGGGDCGQPFDVVALNQDLVANLYDYSGCYTDELRLTLTAADFRLSGDDLFITLANTSGGYSDHYIYSVYYESTDSRYTSRTVADRDLYVQTYTDFTGLPSGRGGMNYNNFRPNDDNAATTFMAGDFDAPIFFYDVVQERSSTQTIYNDWSYWLLDRVGFGGLRMDAIKHFPPEFVARLLDNLAARGYDPGMVVGEFFDGNPGKLADWVNRVNAGVNRSTSAVRIFDFTLREALKNACDNGGYDLRNVFNSSLVDATNLTGFNAVTFVNNHDFRGPGEPVQRDALLAYAYILLNNQLGVPTVFYPDFFGTRIPNAPAVDLGGELSELMDIHRRHVTGATRVRYLNAYGTPYAADYQRGSPDRALIFQLSGGVGSPEVVVAINFGEGTLKVDQQLAGGGSTDYTDLTGNAYNTTARIEGDGRLLIDVPGRSYAVYVHASAANRKLATSTASTPVPGAAKLAVFPNPATDRVIIRNAPGPWSLYGTDGRLLLEGQTTGEANLGNLPGGVYWLRSGAEVRRVVKR